MVMSVVWSLLFGWVMLSSFVLMLPNMDEAASHGWTALFWAVDTQVNPTVKLALYVAIFISQFLCGLATVTSVSRMIFALSRDGGLSFSKALASVSPTFRRFFSFVIPIVLGLFACGPPKWSTVGPWNMGRFWYTVFALLSVLSMVIIFIIGIQPPNDWAM